MSASAAATGQVDAVHDMSAIVEASVSRLFQRLGALNKRAGDANSAAVENLDAAAWGELVEAGLPSAMLGEDNGGVGLDNALLIARLAGASALPLPLSETMAANWLLGKAGLSTTQRPTTFTVRTARLERAGKGWRISGEVSGVPWGGSCDLLLTAVQDAEVFLVRLAQGQFAVHAGASIAGEPRDNCRFDAVVAADQVAALPADFSAQTVQLLGAALRTAQIAGATGAALMMTTAYAAERKQFGRAIGGFQAVQQMLATMATQAAAARVAADLAAEGLMNDMDVRAIAAAKMRAGEAAGVVAAIAHQVHGAIGFTREYDLHRLTRRLWSWRDEFGGEAEWAILLGRQLAAVGGAGLWFALTEI